MLNPVVENLWEIERPLKAPGVRINHRMTVARLRNGDLWVHSPVEWSPELGQALAALGAVRHFVAPSLYHDLHWPAWMEHYPNASFYCPQGFPEEHRDWHPSGHWLPQCQPPRAGGKWLSVFLPRVVLGLPTLDGERISQGIQRTLLGHLIRGRSEPTRAAAPLYR